MLFILIFITSLLVVSFAIPPIIKVSFQKRLFDDPSESRKVHKRIIPNFGGIAIFTGFLFTCSLLIPSHLLPQASVLMTSGLILFMTGLKDDIVGLSPTIKFVAQFAAAFIIAMVANLRIDSLQGLFGQYEMPYYASITLTVFFIVGVVNAFNLIDGIDGLAGSLGVLISLLFAYLFFKAGEFGWAYLSIALSGSLIGFLFFNVTPARIFMGDSGSLLLGYIAAIMSIKFMNISAVKQVVFGEVQLTAGIGLVVAILIIPIFDTLRVFTLRILKNTSPFTADSNHLHHRLLFLSLSHMQSTLILVVVNVLFIVMALAFQNLGSAQLISLLMLSILCLNGLFSLYIESYKRKLFSTRITQDLEESFVSETVPKPVKKSFGEEVLEQISRD